jgi:hypothetical protein
MIAATSIISPQRTGLDLSRVFDPDHPAQKGMPSQVTPANHEREIRLEIWRCRNELSLNWLGIRLKEGWLSICSRETRSG